MFHVKKEEWIVKSRSVWLEPGCAHDTSDSDLELYFEHQATGKSLFLAPSHHRVFKNANIWYCRMLVSDGRCFQSSLFHFSKGTKPRPNGLCG